NLRQLAAVDGTCADGLLHAGPLRRRCAADRACRRLRRPAAETSERPGGRAKSPDRDPDPGEAPLIRPLLRAALLVLLPFAAARALADPAPAPASTSGEPYEL